MFQQVRQNVAGSPGVERTFPPLPTFCANALPSACPTSALDGALAGHDRRLALDTGQERKRARVLLLALFAASPSPCFSRVPALLSACCALAVFAFPLGVASLCAGGFSASFGPSRLAPVWVCWCVCRRPLSFLSLLLSVPPLRPFGPLSPFILFGPCVSPSLAAAAAQSSPPLDQPSCSLLRPWSPQAPALQALARAEGTWGCDGGPEVLRWTGGGGGPSRPSCIAFKASRPSCIGFKELCIALEDR